MRVVSQSVLIAFLILIVAGACFAQTTAGTVHKYDSYGFSVCLPSNCQPISLGNIAAGSQLQEAYEADGLAYLILAVSAGLPKGMTAHTACSMAVQQISAGSAKAGISVHMVSSSTADGDAVQGFGMTVEDNGGKFSKIPPEVKAKFGSSVYQAAILIPVTDSPAVIGVVAVVGPSSREGDCINRLMQITNTFTTGKNGATATTFSSGGTASRDSGVTLKGQKSKVPIAPPQPDIKPFNKLTKGQIELVGVVKSTDAQLKCVDMLVGQAVPAAGHGVMLSPPRLKRVYVKQITDDLKEGAVIVVVAKDTGPGKSVEADTLSVVDMSKLGL